MAMYKEWCTNCSFSFLKKMVSVFDLIRLCSNITQPYRPAIPIDHSNVPARITRVFLAYPTLTAAVELWPPKSADMSSCRENNIRENENFLNQFPSTHSLPSFPSVTHPKLRMNVEKSQSMTNVYRDRNKRSIDSVCQYINNNDVFNLLDLPGLKFNGNMAKNHSQRKNCHRK